MECEISIGCFPVAAGQCDGYTCRDGTFCIPLIWLCDVFIDCPDSSDEDRCGGQFKVTGYSLLINYS